MKKAFFWSIILSPWDRNCFLGTPAPNTRPGMWWQCSQVSSNTCGTATPQPTLQNPTGHHQGRGWWQKLTFANYFYREALLSSRDYLHKHCAFYLISEFHLKKLKTIANSTKLIPTEKSSRALQKNQWSFLNYSRISW